MLKPVSKILIFTCDITQGMNPSVPAIDVSSIFKHSETWVSLRDLINDFVSTNSNGFYRIDASILVDKLVKHSYPAPRHGVNLKIEFYMSSGGDGCQLTVKVSDVFINFNVDLVPMVGYSNQSTGQIPQQPEPSSLKKHNTETIQVNSDFRHAVFASANFKVALCALVDKPDPHQKPLSDELVAKISLFHSVQHSVKLNERLQANGSFSDYLIHSGIVRALLEIRADIVKTTMGPAISLRTTINSCDRENTIESYETMVADTILL